MDVARASECVDREGVQSHDNSVIYGTFRICSCVLKKSFVHGVTFTAFPWAAGRVLSSGCTVLMLDMVWPALF